MDFRFALFADDTLLYPLELGAKDDDEESEGDGDDPFQLAPNSPCDSDGMCEGGVNANQNGKTKDLPKGVAKVNKKGKTKDLPPLPMLMID